MSPLGSASGNLSGTAIVILNIVYTAFFGLLYATAAAVIGMHAVSCMHLELALDSMRERLRRVSPASSQLAAAVSAPGHDEGDEHDDDDDDDGYHALVDGSGRVVSSARDSDAVDAIGMSHPFASVDIRAVRKAMALKHGTHAHAAAAAPAVHNGPPSSAASVAAASAASAASVASASASTVVAVIAPAAALNAPEVFSLNGAGGAVLVPISDDDAVAASRARLSSTHSSAPSSVSLQAYSPPVAPAPAPHSAATPTFSSSAPVFSFAPPYAGSGNGSGGSGGGNERASNSGFGGGGGGGSVDEMPTPLTVLDSVSMDLVHFHKALRRHNKTWGRLVGIVLLVFTLLLVLNAIWSLSSHKHARPTPTPTPHPNATTRGTGAGDATAVGIAFASVAADVEVYKNLAVALLTLFVLIPAIVLPPSLIAEGINKILVTMYIFADDWAASSQQSAGLSVATAASVATAIAPLALPLPAKGAAPHSPSSSSSLPPSINVATSPTAAAAAVPTLSSAASASASASAAAAAAAASAARASANDLIVVRITALMSRVSSLISVDALSARLASVSVSHSMAGGVLFVLGAAALVLIPELISDSPFAH